MIVFISNNIFYTIYYNLFCKCFHEKFTQPAIYGILYKMREQRIHDLIYRVAGPDMTDPRDSAAYLLNLGEPVLIDCGSGFAFNHVLQNIEKTGFDPAQIKNLILTHCHVDHIGGAHLFKSRFKTSLIMHHLDADIVERADQIHTAAFCFDIEFQPLYIDKKITGKKTTLRFGDRELVSLHTPGHTPGSISLYIDIDGTRVLFVQDIGAPLLKDFDCDPAAWVQSIQKLLALDADILCDGHSGAYGPKKNVKRYLDFCVKSQVQQGRISL
jgi:glyoxylase-like metal-dependent hydrolase (beta-lactamase superfamily II)